MRGRILEALREDPRTVPEIAEAIGCPTHEVVFWVMGMRRYGWLSEVKGIGRRRLLPVPGGGAGHDRRWPTLGLYPELQRYGATDMSACFSCGTCTAICPLSENDATFPRRMIRYAQVGMKDALLSSKELWSCYHCGECSDSCPTEADPGEFMAAARRYAIASYDATGLARLMYLRPALGTAFALALAAFFALFMYTAPRPAEHRDAGDLRVHPGRAHPRHRDRGHDPRRRWPGSWASPAWPAGSDAGRASAGGTVFGSRAALARSGRALWSSLGRESLGQARYRAGVRDRDGEPWPGIAAAGSSTRWSCGASWACSPRPRSTTAWTSSGSRRPGRRCRSGTRSACSGPSPASCSSTAPRVMIIDRVRAASSSVARSADADWTLLALLWITGVTGFVLELALYLPEPPAWGYWVFLFHVAVAMELVLLAPFMKLAHAVYRPVGLFFVALAREPREGTGPSHG